MLAVDLIFSLCHIIIITLQNKCSLSRDILYVLTIVKLMFQETPPSGVVPRKYRVGRLHYAYDFAKSAFSSLAHFHNCTS